MNKIAIIDMGTNTFHLLLAEIHESGYRVIHRDHVAVRIGAAGINEGYIAEEACQRALAAMQGFRKTIDQHHVTAVRAFATSAFRNATNGSALASDIKSGTGIPVQVISGDQEAQYIFDGVNAALDLGNACSLVIDIGAGSVEFILGNNHTIHWQQSVEIGGQRLLEKFHKHDPIQASELRALEAYFDETLTPVLHALHKFQPQVLIGSSGTFDTLSDIYCLRHGITVTRDHPETPLTVGGFHEIYAELIAKNREERMQIPGMIALRVDLIVVSCCIIRYLLDKHPFEQIRVSAYSLKEGVLHRLATGRTL